MPPRIAIAVCLLALFSPTAQARDPERLRILSDGYPRAFFFRAVEGPPARRNPDYDRWNADFSRLMGIMGKCLDEEVLGRQKNNPRFFSRFKHEHPEQVVLLHLNGNARDPRFEASSFFAGHWVYRTPARIVGDVPAESGETTVRVSDTSVFRVNMGRYGNRNDDIALFEVTSKGPYDWNTCEQVQLIAIDRAENTIRVRRGQYGTKPRAFKGGRSRAVAHQVEGPWGRMNNTMWYYNFSARCPRDTDGQTAADRYIDDISRWFGPGGILAAYDGLEFDVLFHRTHGDTDGDGIQDDGIIDGVNQYGLGVVEFVRKLRDRMGDAFILQGDGALGPGGSRSQRAWGLLNGIESEGWPHLSDWEIHDWSGGLNRQGYWQAHALPPAFNYINHKYTERVPGGKPGERRRPQVGFHIHRLVFAAACFADSAICYSFPAPRDPDGRFGIWDELRRGAENKLGWLGKPTAPAVHLATRSPDLLWGKSLASMITGPVTTRSTAGGVRVTPHRIGGKGFSFSIPGVRTSGPDLTAAVVMKGRPMSGYPETVARFVELEASSGINLMAGEAPDTGMGLRGEKEGPIDRATGARCRLQKATIDGEKRSAFAAHPPYIGKSGYVYWAKEVAVPPDSELHYSVGMGPKSPARSDGVWFSVHAAVLENGRRAPFVRLEEFASKEHRWIDRRVSLAAYGGKTIRLKFVADCGPRNNTTTDHAYWSRVSVVPKDTDFASRTHSERFMTWLGSECFASTFYFRHIRSKEVTLTFHIEGTEPVTIQSMTVHGHPDAMARVFDKGLVLANPSLKPYKFDLSRIAPEGGYRRLKATATQDTTVNNGEAVEETVTLSPKDALFLVKRE